MLHLRTDFQGFLRGFSLNDWISCDSSLPHGKILEMVRRLSHILSSVNIKSANCNCENTKSYTNSCTYMVSSDKINSNLFRNLRFLPQLKEMLHRENKTMNVSRGWLDQVHSI